MKIFVQIASYRDPELIPTIKSCLENAKYPENLVFGICRQFSHEDKFDDLTEYETDDRFRILNIPHQEALGVCWARNQVQQLYNEEEYTLQIDSHMRFEKDLIVSITPSNIHITVFTDLFGSFDNRTIDLINSSF